MALPLSKLTILVGAGLFGSVLAKEGGRTDVSHFVSRTFKIFMRQIKKDHATTTSRAKPPNDSLLQQVINLRQELQLLASNSPVTIVTSTGSGGKRYGVVIVVFVVGYGYVWWKGWKLPDMMFATRRSLSKASTKIAKELENVYMSISATKRHLSSKIYRVDSNLYECADLSASTREEVSGLHGEMKDVGGYVRSVRHAVKSLETKLSRIEGKQNYTVETVVKLVDVAWNLENGRANEQRIQEAPSSSSVPAIELPQVISSSRSRSLTPSTTKTLEVLPSPSSSGEIHKLKRHLQTAVSSSGLKELHGISDIEEPSGPQVSNRVTVTEDTTDKNNSSYGIFGRRLLSFSSSFISSAYSAMPSFK